MKNLTAILFSLFLCVGIMAQNPAITITTAIPIGNQISFKIGAEVANTTIQVDFGNGTKTNFTAGIISNPATIAGAIVGSQTIKIYGTGINYFECQDKQLTSIDVTSCATLLYLYCNRNNLTELNVKNNTALKTLQFGSNKINNIDLSKNVLLNNLDCSDNRLTSLDLSHNTLLNSVWCNNNYLTLTTVPRLNIGYYIYKPQALLAIPENITVGSILDLSSQSVVDGINTVYEWKTEYNTPLIENKDYTISNGKTTFLKMQSVSVHCVMSNASFPTSDYFGISTTKTMILKQNQTITFNTLPAKKVGDAPFTLAATASSGLPVTYTSSNSLVASISGSTVTILKAGTVTITATQAGNDTWSQAKAEQALSITTATSIGEEKEDSFSVYPNPVADILYIKGEGTGNMNVSIFNLAGTKMWVGIVKGQRLDISQLPAGEYILKIGNNKEKRTLRFIKQ